jgi:3-methylcrotonyl-CoA carboxylase alpha subunit
LKNENPGGPNKVLMKLLNKILIANRGEIAVRIIRTLRRMGIRSVAVYSWRDKDALHVRMADEAYDLGGNDLRETYLDIPKIIHIAQQSGADGIHPGYGFLSENPDFAGAAAEAGINFVGPTSEIIRLMGDKIAARKIIKELEIPMIEGFEGTPEEIHRQSSKLTYPLLVKAAAGGGGKAMRMVHEPSGLKESLEITEREAKNYFGNGLLYVENYLSDARHIEVQILADHYGDILIAGERECSLQRRYQKVIEESPASSLSEKTRANLYNSARKIAQKIGYINAGTLEFLVDKKGLYYFLEMNTRIQVEHAVTEMVTGIDIVELQVQIAAGNQMLLRQDDIHISGHAIEARIYAEDPEKNFMPSPGKIELYHEPKMPGLRIDSGIDGPCILHPEYDPLIAKVIFHGQSRDEAIDGLKNALHNYFLHGPTTNREFIGEILKDPEFLKNRVSTNYLEKITGKLNNALGKRKSEFQRSRIFAAWLGWKLIAQQETCKNSVWKNIGFWRISITKSILFDNKQVDIFVGKITTSSILFAIGNEKHEMKLKSHSPESIIFDLDGVWSSASVSRAYSYEDIICIEGLEFKIRPLDYLPVQPYFIDHQEKGTSGTRVIKSPLHGKISRIYAVTGSEVVKTEVLYALDAMKIENKISSLYNGVVKEIRVKEGDQVQINQTIMIIDSK